MKLSVISPDFSEACSRLLHSDSPSQLRRLLLRRLGQALIAIALMGLVVAPVTIAGFVWWWVRITDAGPMWQWGTAAAILTVCSLWGYCSARRALVALKANALDLEAWAEVLGLGFAFTLTAAQLENALPL